MLGGRAMSIVYDGVSQGEAGVHAAVVELDAFRFGWGANAEHPAPHEGAAPEPALGRSGPSDLPVAHLKNRGEVDDITPSLATSVETRGMGRPRLRAWRKELHRTREHFGGGRSSSW